jgi:hypothetical protein
VRIIRIGATWGAAVGMGIAVLMISLDRLRPFSAPVNWFVKRTIFILCPPYILGFTSFVNGMTLLCIVTVAGNALLYAALFALNCPRCHTVSKVTVHMSPSTG